ncbi:hypothetical protein BCEP4_1020014 [Burkholderia cepacia]|nr:hypothetical protein BCEP4_1020014 [Burkholderia cepacia]
MACFARLPWGALAGEDARKKTADNPCRRRFVSILMSGQCVRCRQTVSGCRTAFATFRAIAPFATK